ncbi:hypothetical protein LEP1GSC050_1824 [Leptospira broomii serovar Hurstbridge str. 5399]|uniref:Dolichyl-phosphate-mannose-protein mannosyltransferase n=1 Tax=Leptospira broomii serovar Hurstbridge str. 5399 TaxID=1049789 RepID=T0FH88_9LEPT|nr:hypothetical protein [Leptospira broomii]EQA47331.1 hypothetical protein LEP1GSC050_1824 [Leptospira broomii serovar Hurstbridge str. 5399]
MTIKTWNFNWKRILENKEDFWKISIFVYFLLIPFFVQLFITSFIDDTYITLTYVRNLSEHFEWGMYPGLPSNSASSPLNVILLSLINVLVRDPELSVFIFTVFIHYLFFIVSYQIGKILNLSRLFAFTLSFIFLFNPLIISTMGLESALLILIFFLSILLYLKDSTYWFGLAIGFLYLTRPDAVLLAFPFWLTSKGIKRKLLSPVLALVVVLPWLFFSWQHFGSFFPDTLLIKKIEKTWGGGYGFKNGWLLYFNSYTRESIFSILPLLLFAPAFFFLKKPFNPIHKLGMLVLASGVIHYFAFSTLKVPPYHWYYAPFLICLNSSVTILFFANNLRKKIRIIWIFLMLLLQLIGFAWTGKETGGFSEMPIYTNWSSRNGYKRLAEEIDRKIKTKTYIGLFAEMGTLAYFSKNGIFINEFSDRTEFIKLYRFLEIKNDTVHPIVSLFIRIMFYNIKRIQDEYPIIKKPPYIILANPSETKSLELIGETSSKWAPILKLYIKENH